MFITVRQFNAALIALKLVKSKDPKISEDPEIQKMISVLEKAINSCLKNKINGLNLKDGQSVDFILAMAKAQDDARKQFVERK